MTFDYDLFLDTFLQNDLEVCVKRRQTPSVLHHNVQALAKSAFSALYTLK